jgi:parvulin-like peptidyl-prolyl isomerase
MRWIKKSAMGVLGVAAFGFLAGRFVPAPQAYAGPPDAKAPATPVTANPNGDPNKRIVAYLHGGRVPITREDLGEYLIARMNPEKIELLVNKMIIETACKERGVTVTAAEIDQVFKEDLANINVNKQQFIDNVLKKYDKTEYEWREDVIKPRLQLGKLCRLDVKVTDEEIQKEFEAEYGQKCEGRLIVWPKGQGQEKFALMQYEDIRASDDKFDEAARQQSLSTLAATGGRIKPFGRNSGTHPSLEAEAFKLKPGQLSTLVATNEGYVCFKLDRILPPVENAKFEDYKERLSKVVYEKKVAAEIPKHFKSLRDAAEPVVLFKKRETVEDLEKNTAQLLQTGGSAPAKK